jgi:hypothetical protein
VPGFRPHGKPCCGGDYGRKRAFSNALTTHSIDGPSTGEPMRTIAVIACWSSRGLAIELRAALPTTHGRHSAPPSDLVPIGHGPCDLPILTCAARLHIAMAQPRHAVCVGGMEPPLQG